MRKTLSGLLLIAWLGACNLLFAQPACPGLLYVANTPEDELMQAVNGTDNPQQQLAALDKFAQTHADSKFMPCVDEYYTIVYLKMNNYDKTIEYGEKGLAANYQDMMLILNVLKAYVSSGKVSDTAFDIILKAPDQIKAEASPVRPAGVTDAEWQKSLQELADQAKDERAYVIYAFFQLAPRLSDPNKQIEALDKFVKTYPDAETASAAQLDLLYFNAYLTSSQLDKALEYGEKTIVADPKNFVVPNRLAYLYAVINRTNLDKAGDYAHKALELAQAAKKPEGVPEDAFKKEMDSQLGMAHITLGYIAFLNGSKTKRLAPAIGEFKTAIDLLQADPALEGEALFFLGYAYEAQYPANHRGAIEALSKSASLPSRFQNDATQLLAKVKAAAGK
jgi:tetratricopeptide (TPR) repeat protein